LTDGIIEPVLNEQRKEIMMCVVSLVDVSLVLLGSSTAKRYRPRWASNPSVSRVFANSSKTEPLTAPNNQLTPGVVESNGGATSMRASGT